MYSRAAPREQRARPGSTTVKVARQPCRARIAHVSAVRGVLSRTASPYGADMVHNTNITQSVGLSAARTKTTRQKKTLCYYVNAQKEQSEIARARFIVFSIMYYIRAHLDKRTARWFQSLYVCASGLIGRGCTDGVHGWRSDMACENSAVDSRERIMRTVRVQ